MSEHDLDGAYQIDGPEGAKALYRDWATEYDREFIDAMGYVAPAKIADLFRLSWDGNGAVLDVGAGTGALAEQMEGVTLDAFDISPEMLEVARQKGLYRNRIAGDLTQPLKIPDSTYRGVISAGTFTHGHVGAGCLDELLRISAPGAQFTCGTNAQIFDSMGFGSTLARLVAEEKITPVRFQEILFYEGVSHDHKDDTGLVMMFRKL